MKTVINFRVLVTLSFFLVLTVLTQGQSYKQAAELKDFGMGVATAKARVTLNEQKVSVADSLIESGNQLIIVSKTEAKIIDQERKKLDKDYSARQKPLTKLTTSKNKGESTQRKGRS